MRLYLFLSLLLAGCTSNDACDGLGTCLALEVQGSGKIDQLIIQVSGEVNGSRMVPTTPHATTLPQTVALEFNPPGGFKGSFGFQVDVTALDALNTVGSGRVVSDMNVGAHAAATVRLTPGGSVGELDMAIGHKSLDFAK